MRRLAADNGDNVYHHYYTCEGCRHGRGLHWGVWTALIIIVMACLISCAVSVYAIVEVRDAKVWAVHLVNTRMQWIYLQDEILVPLMESPQMQAALVDFMQLPIIKEHLIHGIGVAFSGFGGK